MEAQLFFENYTKLESIWNEFLEKEITVRNHSALGMTAMRICYYAVKNPDCALKEIALSLSISPGSASQMVQAMTAGGLLNCIHNKEDRRMISIAPTPVLLDFFKKLS